jgi:predicted metal-dependent phosphoesterase TrpH
MSKSFSFDFHVHSKYSYDSILSPPKIIKVARKVGLNGIAITDHNTIRGGMEAKKIGDESIFIIIGAEIKTDRGDVIGLFLSNDIGRKDFNDVIDEIREQDGLVVLPHPYKLGEDGIEKLGQKADIIEVKNGRLTPYKNEMAEKLAKSLSKPIIGGSDAHTAIEIGCIKTLFKEEVSSEEELRKMLLNSSQIVVGRESPRWVHYVSSAIGRTRTLEFRGLFKAINREFNR